MYEEINYKELSKYCRDLTIEEATEITENEKKSTKRLLKFLIFSFIFVSIFLVLIFFDFLETVKINIELTLIDEVLLEKINSIFGIIVEMAIIIALSYLIYFILKKYKSYKEYYISLFSNPIMAGKDYEIFNGIVLKKRKSRTQYTGR